MKQVEVARSVVVDKGVKVLPLHVKNMGVVHRRRKILNRIEFTTNFDFSKVDMLQISESHLICPFKPDFKYCDVILSTKGQQKLVMLFGYLYAAKNRDSLKNWLLINSKMEETELCVETF
eukprot:GEMP01081145.1.p2 GENE.GEMP01081145.1~~GEMP01081145.1.p2  ORF type:complete len:120 (+),score=19.13 GEMP01081145.1:674-1033(+)